MNRTKKAICDTFWEILEEKPYNKITVQNIVEKCQVNRNTFYYYFQDIPALAEYTIREWADNIIQNNCAFGEPMSCIMPLANECMERRMAFLHLYRSSNRETFMQRLNETSFHIVRSYTENSIGDIPLSQEKKEMLTHFYKCAVVGTILDWLDSEMKYDLVGFCQDIDNFFADSVKELILKHADMV